MARIAIAGGSIGGLTAACLLRDTGHDVTVFERSPAELKDRGAGIVCLESTSRYLTERAGVAIDDIAIKTEYVRYLGRDNQTVFQQAHAYRFSSWTTIYRELLKAFGNHRYQLGHEMVGWTSNEDGVDLRFSNGASFKADLLLCADGVVSLGRAKLQPGAVPCYAGYAAWRGVLPERGLDSQLAETKPPSDALLDRVHKQFAARGLPVY